MPKQQRCVIDIEASGFGRHSYPIEVGYVREDGQAWCSLVRPAEDWLHWDPEAEQVHGIQRHQLLEHGRSVHEVAQRLNQDLAGQVLYCDGWAHDYAWLARLFEAAQLNPLFRLESVVRLLSEQQLARLDDARLEAFTALGITRHRASSDARALQWALQRLAA
jgi:hypothetical protein